MTYSEDEIKTLCRYNPVKAAKVLIEMQKEVVTLKSRIKNLRAALEFYSKAYDESGFGFGQLITEDVANVFNDMCRVCSEALTEDDKAAT